MEQELVQEVEELLQEDAQPGDSLHQGTGLPLVVVEEGALLKFVTAIPTLRPVGNIPK